MHEGTKGDRSLCGWCFYKGNPPALSAIAEAGLNLPPPVPVPLQHPVPRGDTAVQRKHAKQHGKEYTSNTPKGKFKFGLSLVETAGVLVIAYVVMRNLGNLLALCLVFYDRWMLILSMASMITYLYRKVYLLSDDPYAPALAFSTEFHRANFQAPVDRNNPVMCVIGLPAHLLYAPHGYYVHGDVLSAYDQDLVDRYVGHLPAAPKSAAALQREQEQSVARRKGRAALAKPNKPLRPHHGLFALILSTLLVATFVTPTEEASVPLVLLSNAQSGRAPRPTPELLTDYATLSCEASLSSHNVGCRLVSQQDAPLYEVADSLVSHDPEISMSPPRPFPNGMGYPTMSSRSSRSNRPSPCVVLMCLFVFLYYCPWLVLNQLEQINKTDLIWSGCSPFSYVNTLCG